MVTGPSRICALALYLKGIEQDPPLTPHWPPQPQWPWLYFPVPFSAPSLPNTEVTPHLDLPYLLRGLLPRILSQNPCQFFLSPSTQASGVNDLYTKEVCLRRCFQNVIFLGLNTVPQNSQLSPLAKAHRTSNWEHRNTGPQLWNNTKAPQATSTSNISLKANCRVWTGNFSPWLSKTSKLNTVGHTGVLPFLVIIAAFGASRPPDKFTSLLTLFVGEFSGHPLTSPFILQWLVSECSRTFLPVIGLLGGLEVLSWAGRMAHIQHWGFSALSMGSSGSSYPSHRWRQGTGYHLKCFLSKWCPSVNE